MQVSVSDAKAQLTDLVRRAEAGDEIILTRHGKAAVQLVPVMTKPTSAERTALIARLRAEVGAMNLPSIDAARSQDFLYDEHGLPA